MSTSSPTSLDIALDPEVQATPQQQRVELNGGLFGRVLNAVTDLHSTKQEMARLQDQLRIEKHAVIEDLLRQLKIATGVDLVFDSASFEFEEDGDKRNLKIVVSVAKINDSKDFFSDDLDEPIQKLRQYMHIVRSPINGAASWLTATLRFPLQPSVEGTQTGARGAVKMATDQSIKFGEERDD